MFEIMHLYFSFDIKNFGSFMVKIGLLVGIYTSMKMGIVRKINISRLVIIGFAWLCFILGSYFMYM